MKKNNFTKRAVSEVISSLLLLAIAVVGASILAVFINQSFEGGSFGQTNESQPVKVLQLRAFDTRDGESLMNVDDLDNKFVPGTAKLCAISCDIDPDNIPENDGTEFFVVTLENKSVNPIYLDKIYVNNILHTWDDQTLGKDLDTSSDDTTGKYPLSGKFSIFDDINDPEQLSKEIPSGKQTHVLVKLSDAMDDIELNKAMIIRINVGDLPSQNFIIESGGAQ